MFYRPHFCCHCGEKIIRDRWRPLTSRRFCEFCAIEQKQHDLLPRAVMFLALLIGAAGLTAYFAGSDAVDSRRARVIQANRQPRSTPNPQIPTANGGTRVPPPPVSKSNSVQRDGDGNSSTEAVFYCGALTKKGTPCTRRVKSKGRCWQHIGQPSVEPQRK